ncbi:MAG: response regulator transcription factor [Clostridiales bacterium]|nr:response regulator transcription factor [Clostridiales bacterium]
MEENKKETVKKILIVDDEMRMRRIIADYLQIKGYEPLCAEDGVRGLELFLSEQPDMVLLDVMMPRMDGWEVCRRIRSEPSGLSATPVIMLTAKGQEEDELQGFALGADEYIMKPFSLKILLARIEAVFRRGEALTAPAAASLSPSASAGEAEEGMQVDRMGRVVRLQGQPVELTYTEFELLLYLMDNAGVALSRDKILDNVWRYDYYGDARTVDTHVKKLRNKLGEYGDRIKTIRGIGYKFEAPSHP